jgi:hypothetical protein
MTSVYHKLLHLHKYLCPGDNLTACVRLDTGNVLINYTQTKMITVSAGLSHPPREKCIS